MESLSHQRLSLRPGLPALACGSGRRAGRSGGGKLLDSACYLAYSGRVREISVSARFFQRKDKPGAGSGSVCYLCRTDGAGPFENRKGRGESVCGRMYGSPGRNCCFRLCGLSCSASHFCVSVYAAGYGAFLAGFRHPSLAAEGEKDSFLSCFLSAAFGWA